MDRYDFHEKYMIVSVNRLTGYYSIKLDFGRLIKFRSKWLDFLSTDKIVLDG